jgi:hypothetical protein
VRVLVQVLNRVLAVPLGMRIHEGLVWSNRDRRTLLDKMLSLINILGVSEPFYFVGDAYYAAGKMAEGLLEHGNHLITRVKSNAVADDPLVAQGPKRRGRPRLYGQKIALKAYVVSFEESVGVEIDKHSGVGTAGARCCLLFRPDTPRRVLRRVGPSLGSPIRLRSPARCRMRTSRYGCRWQGWRRFAGCQPW